MHKTFINSTIYRGFYDNFEKEIVVKILNSEYPTNEQIIRFNNEYEFTKDLEISRIRKDLFYSLIFLKRHRLKLMVF